MAERQSLGEFVANKDQAFTGRPGLVYLFDNGLAPFVSYSESLADSILHVQQHLGCVSFSASSSERTSVGCAWAKASST
jgi:hypothetical protein